MITNIAVIGAGQMGSGIAQVAATSGMNVLLIDVNDAQLKAAESNIKKSLEKLAAKGRIESDSVEKIANSIQYSNNTNGIKPCEMIIEAATETEEIKRKIIEDLSKKASPDALFATNTSSLSITRLASYSDRPDRFIGMHFMNPVPIMKLVEVIRGIATSDTTHQATLDLCQRFGKTPVASEDFPGFIINRILMPMINEAIFVLHEGIGTVEAIDTGMKLGTNQPMGPLALADLIGLDTTLSIINVLYKELGEDKYRPCPLLVKYVEAGWLGRKTKRGFYDYTTSEPTPTR